ncbi:MAG: hypothetical protein COA85_05390 [Robiginitomaculum sp.]|nr:MAG: hypothetical protein COA85_05390 [Robiginitomaculum sp.]
MQTAILCSAKSSWREEGQDWKAKLESALEQQAVAVHHIGSTAISGLPSKDIIDLQVEVASLENRKNIIDALQAARFVHKPSILEDSLQEGFGLTSKNDWAKLYFREPVGQRSAHIHVRVCGAPNALLAVWFRDWLRQDKTASLRYAQMKLALATDCAENLEHYVLRKDVLMHPFLQQAIAWARAR